MSYNLHYVKYSIELQLFKHPLVPHPLLMMGVVSFRCAHPYSILFQPTTHAHLLRTTLVFITVNRYTINTLIFMCKCGKVNIIKVLQYATKYVNLHNGTIV